MRDKAFSILERIVGVETPEEPGERRGGGDPLSVSSNGSLGLKQHFGSSCQTPQFSFSILERIVGVETNAASNSVG